MKHGESDSFAIPNFVSCLKKKHLWRRKSMLARRLRHIKTFLAAARVSAKVDVAVLQIVKWTF